MEKTRKRIGTVAASLLFAIASVTVPSVLLAQEQDPKESRPQSSTSSATPTAAANSDRSTESAKSDAAEGIKPPSDFKIGVGDELMVSVWHEPEFSQSVVVRPDGMITLPLLNDIKVVGLSTTEMQALLTDKMKSLVNDPQVTVIVRAINSRKVWLTGNVNHQGMYQLIDKKTVLELLSEAGGLGPFAKARSIYILREVDGKKIKIAFDYKKAISGKGENPVLQSGDMVVVP